jgi:hypothetical protein
LLAAVTSTFILPLLSAIHDVARSQPAAGSRRLAVKCR